MSVHNLWLCLSLMHTVSPFPQLRKESFLWACCQRNIMKMMWEWCLILLEPLKNALSCVIIQEPQAKVIVYFLANVFAYLYRFSRDIPILALNHDFPISCGGVPILEDAGIFRAFRFRFVLFSPVFPNPPRILHLPPVKALRCRYK